LLIAELMCGGKPRAQTSKGILWLYGFRLSRVPGFYISLDIRRFIGGQEVGAPWGTRGDGNIPTGGVINKHTHFSLPMGTILAGDEAHRGHRERRTSPCMVAQALDNFVKDIADDSPCQRDDAVGLRRLAPSYGIVVPAETFITPRSSRHLWCSVFS
jgi:hypothetical protein